MGDLNQYNWIKQCRNQLEGPVLEVGSRDYGSTPNLRPLFEGEDYVGIDMSEGKSVDMVLDMTRPFEEISAELGNRQFGTIICLSVMEHVDKPFLMAENLSRLLKPGGKLCVSVPFHWKFHGYPSDYWRFTHEGVKKLFAGLDFDSEHNNATSSRLNEVMQLNDSVGMIKMSGKKTRKAGHFIRGISIDILRLLSALGILRWLVGYRYLMVPTMINMVGRKP